MHECREKDKGIRLQTFVCECSSVKCVWSAKFSVHFIEFVQGKATDLRCHIPAFEPTGTRPFFCIAWLVQPQFSASLLRASGWFNLEALTFTRLKMRIAMYSTLYMYVKAEQVNVIRTTPQRLHRRVVLRDLSFKQNFTWWKNKAPLFTLPYKSSPEVLHTPSLYLSPRLFYPLTLLISSYAIFAVHTLWSDFRRRGPSNHDDNAFQLSSTFT